MTCWYVGMFDNHFVFFGVKKRDKDEIIKEPHLFKRKYLSILFYQFSLKNRLNGSVCTNVHEDIMDSIILLDTFPCFWIPPIYPTVH